MADQTNLYNLKLSAFQYISDRMKNYENNPQSRPNPEKVSAVLRLDNVTTNLAIPSVVGDIPILDFKIYKNRNYEHSGIDICYALVCASETDASKSEALIMQKMNQNTLLDNFVIAKLDDKSGKSEVTVVYQLQQATILDVVSGGQYTGVISTAKIETIMYITDGGKITTSYNGITGIGN